MTKEQDILMRKEVKQAMEHIRELYLDADDNGYEIGWLLEAYDNLEKFYKEIK